MIWLKPWLSVSTRACRVRQLSGRAAEWAFRYSLVSLFSRFSLRCLHKMATTPLMAATVVTKQIVQTMPQLSMRQTIVVRHFALKSQPPHATQIIAGLPFLEKLSILAWSWHSGVLMLVGVPFSINLLHKLAIFLVRTVDPLHLPCMTNVSLPCWLLQPALILRLSHVRVSQMTLNSCDVQQH